MTTYYCTHNRYSFTLTRRGKDFSIRINHKLNSGSSIHVATGELLCVTTRSGKPLFYIKVAGFHPKIYYGKYITSGTLVPEWISDY